MTGVLLPMYAAILSALQTSSASFPRINREVAYSTVADMRMTLHVQHSQQAKIGGKGADELEILANFEDLLEHDEQEIRVDTSFVDLVDDEMSSIR